MSGRELFARMLGVSAGVVLWVGGWLYIAEAVDVAFWMAYTAAMLFAIAHVFRDGGRRA